MIEQLLIKELKNNKISKKEQFRNFGWTETFNVEDSTILNIIKSKENIEKEFNETFRKNRT